VTIIDWLPNETAVATSAGIGATLLIAVLAFDFLNRTWRRGASDGLRSILTALSAVGALVAVVGGLIALIVPNAIWAGTLALLSVGGALIGAVSITIAAFGDSLARYNATGTKADPGRDAQSISRRTRRSTLAVAFLVVIVIVAAVTVFGGSCAAGVAVEYCA
jgi:hypothetical protein